MQNNNLLEPLIILNNIRFNYIKKLTQINRCTILDLGCGAGYLSEKLATHGGIVTGIDNSEKLITIAKKNALKKKLSIEYKCTNLKDFLRENNKLFDIIISTEVIEHIKSTDDIITLFLNFSHSNTSIFLSSLNCNISTYLSIIFFGEYIFNKLLKKTHIYEKFIDAYNIKTLINKNFHIKNIKGFTYYPVLYNAKLSNKFNINYIIYAKKKN